MIELKKAIKRFDSYTALDGIDLKVEKGAAFGLLGSNGAGKSTILRLLSGIYRPDSGEVLIDGKKVYNNEEIKSRVFFINDETIQYTGYTLEKLKDYYKSYYANFSEELFENLRNKVKLPLDKKLSTFSKGMKRQAIVIIALASKPDLLLMDEAFDGLDPTMRIIVKKMLVDAMLDRSMTTIISSHNLREINEVCDTAALLHEGKIIFSRDIDSVKGNVHKIQAVFEKDAAGNTPEYTADDFKDLEILHFEKNQSIYYIIAKGEEDVIKAAMSPKRPVLLELIPLSLEEVFIYELEVLGYDSSDITQE